MSQNSPPIGIFIGNGVLLDTPSADGTSGQVIETDGAGKLGFINQPTVITSHGNLTDLLVDDHPQYILADGSRDLTGQLASTVSTGTSPFAVSSTTVNTNFNADLLDGNHASAFALSSHVHSAADITTGTLVVPRGGTGFGSYVIGDILFADTTSTLKQLSIGTVDQVLTSPGVGSGPFWQTPDTVITSHGDLTDLLVDDHTQYLLSDGSRNLTGQLTSTVITGTSPFSITSTTLNINLNADLLDGLEASAFALFSHNHDAANIISGIFGIPRGGTGFSSYTIGDILYASATTALSTLAADTSGKVLTTNGPSTAPSWETHVAPPHTHSHGDLTDLLVDDHTQYFLADGTRDLTGQLTSTVITGTAPFVIASTTVSTNLNADLLDGNEATAFSLTSHVHDAADITTGILPITRGGTGSTSLAADVVPRSNGTAYVAGIITDDGSRANIIGSGTVVAKFGRSTAADSRVLFGNSAGDTVFRTTSTGNGEVFSDTAKTLRIGANGVANAIQIATNNDIQMPGFLGIGGGSFRQLDVIGTALTVAAFRRTTPDDAQTFVGNSAGSLVFRVNATGNGEIRSDASKTLRIGANGVANAIQIATNNDIQMPGFLSIGHTLTATATLDLRASETGRASLRLRTGVTPTSPNDGEMWQDGTSFFGRVSGVTKDLAAGSAGGLLWSGRDLVIVDQTDIGSLITLYPVADTGSRIIAADSIKAGDIYIIRLIGFYLMSAGPTPSCRVVVNFGSGAIVDHNIDNLQTGTQYDMVIYVAFREDGDADTDFNATGFMTFYDLSSNDNAGKQQQMDAGAGMVNGTIANTIDVSAEFSTGTTGVINSRITSIELLRVA